MSPTPSKPWIIGQFTQKDQTDWWVELKVLSAKSAPHVVFGKAEFDSNDNLSSIDTLERSRPHLTSPLTTDGFENTKEFLVDATEVSNGGTYNVEENDAILDVETVSGTKTVVSLPKLSNVREGRMIRVKDANGNASTGNIDITTETGDTIEGSDTVTIDTDYNEFTVRAGKPSFNSNQWLEVK